MAHLMRRGRGSSNAFTLIELLVVVAIIGVLISILLPSLKGARDQAKQLLCITHLRSIGQASSFYADEYNDWVIANESQEGFIPRPGLPAGYPRDDSFAHTQFAISLLNGLLYDHAVHGLYNSRNQAAMLPFSALPRVANDRRHPGGLNNVFFDGHVENMSFPRLDAGWPKSLGIRLRWFTTAPEAEW